MERGKIFLYLERRRWRCPCSLGGRDKSRRPSITAHRRINCTFGRGASDRRVTSDFKKLLQLEILMKFISRIK